MSDEHPMTQITRSSVVNALEAIKPLIHRTPVFTSSSLSNSLPGRNTLYFKAENLQKGGAFKFRGASYSLGRLTEDQLKRGVCTHSSGTLQIYRNPSISKDLMLERLSMQETMPAPLPWPPKSAAWDVSSLWSVARTRLCVVPDRGN